MKNYQCSVCQTTIPQLRVEYLESEGIEPNDFHCVKHSTTTKKKGFFMQPNDLGEGEVDCSELVICDRIDPHTVRDVLRKADSDEDPEAEPETSDISTD